MGTYSVIVTGGGGYFGQLLVAALQADGHKVQASPELTLQTVERPCLFNAIYI
jgi:nucleoside-diphosphate-sugar epimerase